MAIVLTLVLIWAPHLYAGETPVTFNNQVVRIFQQHCQGCHRPGNIAPFSLLTYADATSYAYSIRHEVTAHTMPPWKPIDPVGTFQAERRLTDNEIQTIAKWVDEGMVEGSSADLPEPIKFPEEWTY